MADLFTSTTVLPAKILLQIRDGVPNLISEFDIVVENTEEIRPDDPSADPYATFRHDVEIKDVIVALYHAEAACRANLRKAAPAQGLTAQGLLGIEIWLANERSRILYLAEEDAADTAEREQDERDRAFDTGKDL